MALPMLGEFALRLAGGLAGLLLLTPSRQVPLAFFRTQFQIIMALLVLAALDQGRSDPDRVLLGLTIAAAALGFVGSVAWGLGLPRVGVPAAALIVTSVAAVLIGASRTAWWPLWALNSAEGLASGAVMGSTLTAMLLGHHYLTAPAMSIEPLKRFVRAMVGSLAVRTVLGGVALWAWYRGLATTTHGGGVTPLFLAIRWVVGLAGPTLATYLAWKTVQIRSTQSATGILYIAMILVLFGEVTATALSHRSGVFF
ncbi:MAG TPA: hypothetical protein VGZ22_16580 [Isosphaeraceae bacterium]|jgi:hypothetical protein|nr:hypothetical protein [Isosphaeraceae bacterium]